MALLRRRTGVAPRTLVATASLIAIAAVLGLVESAFPTPIPGARLGLANVAVVLALVTMGRGPALIVGLGKVLVVGLAAGTLAGPVGLLAAAGALLSWGTMSLTVWAVRGASVVGVSAVGGFSHVLGQLLATAALAGSCGVLALGSLSLSAGLLFGLATGLVARIVLSRLNGVVPTGE